jgi:N-acetylneuraminic acid mutarotase
MMWVDAYDNLYLFGGFGHDSAGGAGVLNDLWKWDGVNWTWLSGSALRHQWGTYGTKEVPQLQMFREPDATQLDG